MSPWAAAAAAAWRRRGGRNKLNAILTSGRLRLV